MAGQSLESEQTRKLYQQSPALMLLFNSATGLKYSLPEIDRRLDCRTAIDYSLLK